MTKEDPKANNTLDLLTNYAVSQRHIPTLIESSVSRRTFLCGGAITGLTFALTPWEKALAAHRFPELEMIGGAPPPLPMAGLWDVVLQVGRIIAGLLGFGTQFQTVYTAVDYILRNKDAARQNAKAAMKTVQDEITQHAKDYIPLDLHLLEEKFIDEFKKAIQTVFAAGNAGTAMLGTHPRDMVLAHAAPAKDIDRFYAMTLADSSLNSLVPMFDYGVGDSSYDARALVGLPTLQSFRRTMTRRRLVESYGQELRDLIYPQSQSATYRAYGVWEKTYKIQDRHETAKGTTLEYHFEHKGAYTVNNAAPGTVYGELTTILGQFPDGKTRKNYEFTDTYCWIPPLTKVDQPCIG